MPDGTVNNQDCQPNGACSAQLGRHLDTVGESFELNTTAAQEAGTLAETVRPITIEQ
jgi:activator of 2-hydroxyglutaryl-CoA dehydratase